MPSKFIPLAVACATIVCVMHAPKLDIQASHTVGPLPSREFWREIKDHRISAISLDRLATNFEVLD